MRTISFFSNDHQPNVEYYAISDRYHMMPLHYQLEVLKSIRKVVQNEIDKRIAIKNEIGSEKFRSEVMDIRRKTQK